MISLFLFHNKLIKAGLVINFSGECQHVAVSNYNFSSSENFHVPHHMATYDVTVFVGKGSMEVALICKCSNK